MADSTTDFLQDYQALARNAWDAWARQLQQAGTVAPTQASAAPSAAEATLERTLDGVRGYMNWLQGMMANTMAPGSDWQRQLPQWFGGVNGPFAQAFAGIDSAGAQGFVEQWQAWMQAAQQSGVAPAQGHTGPVPAFGLDREQQMQQQELAQALLTTAQATGRYQALLQRAAADGLQRLQGKLAQHTGPGQQIDSLKGLYDLWVDAAEEAYAEIALTEKFRAAYGDMVNAQMHVRQLQQKHIEAFCQQLGMPTRSEVSSLGQRVQALRRDLRTTAGAADGSLSDRVDALARELDAPKQQRARQRPAPASRTTTRRAAAGTGTAAKRTRATATAAKPPVRRKPAAGKRTGASVSVAARGAAKPRRGVAAARPARRPSGKRK
ncbi:MAG: pha synthase subunit protein [Xanthomonadales bacterium]|nr:pha synthase subunit protein [Xanthomonadales bacterium]